MPRNDMGPDDLYRYVASVAKRRQIKFDELARRMQMSKTTLWRYMKGMNAFTPELEKRICEALEISEEDGDELRRLISINLVDSSLVAARYSIDKFMFGDSSCSMRPTQLDFAYYHNGASSRKSSDITREIIEFTEKPDCECEAWVVNCAEGVTLENVTYLLSSLIPSSKSGSIEQLVSLPDKNYRRNIMLFLSLLPLIRVNGYSMRYIRSGQAEQAMLARKNAVLIRISYTESGEKRKCYYCITFSTNDVSQCLRFEDDTVFGFIKANYDAYSRLFSLALPERVNLDPFGQYVYDYESAGDYAMIKHDLSYSAIPPDAYQSLVARMSEEETSAFAQSVEPGCQDPAKKLKDAMANLKKRNKSTYAHKSIFVHSRIGLEDFARTGCFRDAHAVLPPFTRREMRRILENVKNRMTDENDPFEMYITYKDFLFCGQELSASRGCCAYIDVGVTKRLKGMNGDVYVKDAQLADTIYDYASNHIPAYQALESEEAVRFINSLISKYTE